MSVPSVKFLKAHLCVGCFSALFLEMMGDVNVHVHPTQEVSANHLHQYCCWYMQCIIFYHDVYCTWTSFYTMLTLSVSWVMSFINNRGVSDMDGVIILFGGCRTSTPAVCRDSLPDTPGTNLAQQGRTAFTACLYPMNGTYQRPVL